jgi:hypothetical protein
MFQSLDEGIVVFKNSTINFQNEVFENIFKLSEQEADEDPVDIIDQKIFR